MSELVKNDHKRIVAILNIINKEICNVEDWNFLLRKTQITLPANTNEVKNSIFGKILYLTIDKQKYNYCNDLEPFMISNSNRKIYGEFAANLVFPKFKEDKIIDIIYYTKNCVRDENGTEKEELTSPTDCSLIPMPFAEQLLVYGTCLRLKANPQYIKFSYWMSMYKEALLNLKSKSYACTNNAPIVKLFRK